MTGKPLDQLVREFFEARDRQPMGEPTEAELHKFSATQQYDYQRANWALRQAVYGPSGFPAERAS